MPRLPVQYDAMYPPSTELLVAVVAGKVMRHLRQVLKEPGTCAFGAELLRSDILNPRTYVLLLRKPLIVLVVTTSNHQWLDEVEGCTHFQLNDFFLRRGEQSFLWIMVGFELSLLGVRMQPKAAVGIVGVHLLITTPTTSTSPMA